MDINVLRAWIVLKSIFAMGNELWEDVLALCLILLRMS